MVDKRTIGISSLITLGIVILSMITPTFFDIPKYYCEQESSIMECPGGLSGGLGTRCYLTEGKTSWDSCLSGWMEITDDLIIQDPEPSEIPVCTKGLKWECSPESCIKIE